MFLIELLIKKFKLISHRIEIVCMPCPVCGSDPTDYLCNSCKRSVCFSCARTVGKDVLCVECAKNSKKPAKEKDALYSAFVYSFILTAGLLLIYLVGQYAIFNLSSVYSGLLPESAVSIIDLLKGTSALLVAASGVLTAFLYIIHKVRKKPKPTK